MRNKLLKQLTLNIKQAKRFNAQHIIDDYNHLVYLTKLSLGADYHKYLISLKEYQQICGLYQLLKENSYLVDKDDSVNLQTYTGRYNFIIRLKKAIPKFYIKLYELGANQVCIMYINILKHQKLLKFGSLDY